MNWLNVWAMVPMARSTKSGTEPVRNVIYFYNSRLCRQSGNVL